MRGWVLAVALLCPSVMAETIASDASDDPVVTIAGQPVDAPRWAAIDLLELQMEEHAQEFAFVLAVKDLDAEGENLIGVDEVRYHVYFTYEGAHYRATIVRLGFGPVEDSILWGGSLQTQDAASGRWIGLRELDPTVDVAADTLGLMVPRQLVVGIDGAGVSKGRPLEGIFATAGLSLNNSTLLNTPGGSIEYPLHGVDRMPDEGAVQWVIRHGIEQSGHAQLASPSPVRVSNGEATTFLFELHATSQGEAQEPFVLRALDAPPSWTVTFPQQRVRIDPGQTLTLPVLVTVPFQHEHGTFAKMLVEMQSQYDPDSIGRAELGIRYTAVPQPSGHHDTLYFHTAADRRAYMNALDEDEADTGETAISFSSCSCSGYSIARHDVNLLPGLLMGLDFDLDRTGTGEVTVVFDQPVSGVRISGEFAVYPGDEPARRPGFFTDDNEFAVAVVPAIEGLEFAAGEPKTVPFEVRPLPRGDYLPYEQDSWLVLHLDVAVAAYTPMCCLVEPDGRLVPGGHVVLPLDEYHDEVDQYFTTLSGVELSAVGSQKRLANPGETVVLNATIANVGTTAGTYRLELSGHHTEWARMLGSSSFSIGPGQTRQLAVAVGVPADAADGEQADITLHAASKTDPNVRSLLRFLVEVDTAADHQDEAALADQLDGELTDRKSPGPGWLVLAALAALASRRR